MLREYQQRAIDRLYDWFSNNESGNPCLVLPTGSGKSHIIAALVKDAMTNWPETRVLMLTHQKELIAQNAEKLRQHWRNAPMGIYSASLGLRTLSEPITFAGVQSVAKRADEIGYIDLVIVDECHSINHKQSGQYRKLLGNLIDINPHLRIIGLSATPYRLGHGYIHEGYDAIFNDLIEPVSIEELVTQGYLSPLRSKHTDHALNVDGVKKQGGEFIASELEAAVDTFDNNDVIVAETIKRASDRKSWLFFCTGVNHAEHLSERLNEYGIDSECLTGKTSMAKRDQILSDFKSGKIRALTNVNVLTTGFDYPGIDCLVMARPTLSPGLYVQMAGRGMRVADNKADCLVLDFAGNVSMHGPITSVQPPAKAKSGDGFAPTKKCEACQEIVAASCKRCPSCGFEFAAEEEAVVKPVTLHDDDIMGFQPIEMAVTSWRWDGHVSRTSGKEMLKVSYYGGISDPIVTEYLPVLHEGYAGEKATRLLRSFLKHGGIEYQGTDDIYDTADCLNRYLEKPKSIGYLREGKFFKVTNRSWAHE